MKKIFLKEHSTWGILILQNAIETQLKNSALLAIWPYTNYLAFLDLGFIIYKES